MVARKNMRWPAKTQTVEAMRRTEIDRTSAVDMLFMSSKGASFVIMRLSPTLWLGAKEGCDAQSSRRDITRRTSC